VPTTAKPNYITWFSQNIGKHKSIFGKTIFSEKIVLTFEKNIYHFKKNQL
jgi:hypothetical protein